MTWRVHSPKRSVWNVESTRGGREWTGAPSQPAAFALARSLAAIDVMLAAIRPRLTVVDAPHRREYGCYRIPTKTH